MDFKTAQSFIHSLTRFGSQLGLERMNALLELMGNPHKKLKFIHIAGTNGKGSVANMCANVLTRSKYRVGLYTSPFVNEFLERFQINGNAISRVEFAKHAEIVKKHIETLADKGMQVTEFEAITAIAFEYFSKKACDIVCLEVGLGGQFDATNVIDTPELAIITSISMDHVAILGDTIEKIALEKAGIIKENTTVVSYPLQSPEAVSVIMEKCAKTNSTMVMSNIQPKDISITPNGTCFTYDYVRYDISLIGEHQAYNAITVITAVEELRKKGYKIDNYYLKVGMLTTKVPARFEKVFSSTSPDLYIDGAHNLEAIKALIKTMDKIDAKNKVVIMGMMADKDYVSSVKEVASKCYAFIAVPIDNPRCEDKNVIAAEAKKYCKNVFAIDNYKEALIKARELATADGVLFACGSFYMAKDIKSAVLEVADYKGKYGKAKQK